MPLRTDELAALDRMLDQALELAPEERARWIDALDAESAALAGTLRQLFATRAMHETADVLDRPLSFARLLPEGERSDAGFAPGTEIGPYRLRRELGVGGMGTVWLAERTDGLVDRPVALKLPLFSVRHRALADRFARERAILARLAHPSIARLYDAGIAAGGQPFLALEYVEGEPLTAWCDARAAPARQRVALVVGVLRAVQYAHANLVIHRDLKPSNILVTAEGEVRLLDFGIAKLMHDDGDAGETELTRLNGRALTLSYAAPEVLAGAPVGIAADVYSVGVILYELLTGARPYRPRDESRGALEDAILRDEPLPPSLAIGEQAATRRGAGSAKKLSALLAGDLDTIVLKALKKPPGERYATAAAMAEDLERAIRGEAIEARADSALYRAGRLLMRHRLAFGTAGIVAVALVAGASVAIWQAREARRESQRAQAVQEFVVDLFRANRADQADPLKARAATARELLDRGSARIADALGDQPESRIQLLETLAKLYTQLGLWAEASDLGAQRVALARSLYGASDLRVADALRDQFSSLQVREGVRGEDVEALIVEALRIHDRNGDTDSVARARLHQLASQHYINRSPPTALDHALRAVRIFRSRHSNDANFPDALADLAQIHVRQGDRVAGLALHDEALRAARALPLPDHALLRFVGRAGEAQALYGNGEAADALLREAIEMSDRVNGSRHMITVTFRRMLARNLAWIGRTDEAATVATRVIADLNAAEGRENYRLRETHRMLFDVHWARGDLAAAREGVEAALATYTGETTDTFEHSALLLQRSIVETVTGRPAEALASVAHASSIAQRLRMSPASLLMGNIALEDAQARLATRDFAGARAMLEAQRERWPTGEASVAGLRARLQAMLAEAVLGAGDAASASRIAQLARSELEPFLQGRGMPLAEAQVETARARVLMSGSAFGPALSHLDRAAELYASIQVADSPFRSEVEALRALCLARIGRGSEARASLERARVAHARHASLADRFIAPLRDAESALSLPASAGAVGMRQ